MLLISVVENYFDELTVHYDAVDLLIAKVNRAVNAYSSVIMSNGTPIDFAARVWPCLRDAFCQLDFYLSMDELH